MALDRSESTDNFRAQQFSAIDTASYMAMANGAKVEIWCYDTHPKIVYGPTNPDQIQAVTAVKRDNMIPDPQHLRERTRPAELLELIEQEVTAAGAPKDIRIAMLTDGDNDFLADGKRIKKALEAIGSVPGTRIAVIGATSDNVAYWNGLLQPYFPGRFKVATLPDSTQAVAWTVK